MIDEHSSTCIQYTVSPSSHISKIYIPVVSLLLFPVVVVVATAVIVVDHCSCCHGYYCCCCGRRS